MGPLSPVLENFCLFNLHTCYYFWSHGSEEVLVEPKGSCVTGARVLTAATVMYQFRSAGKTGNWVATSENGHHPAICRSDGCALVSWPIETKIITTAIEFIFSFVLTWCKLYTKWKCHEKSHHLLLFHAYYSSITALIELGKRQGHCLK